MRVSTIRIISALAFGAFIFAASEAHAQAVLSNFSAPANGDRGTNIRPADQKTVSFTVGSSAISVTSFQASLAINVGTTPGDLSVGLFTADANGDPLLLVSSFGTQTITNPFSSAGAQTYTFAPSSAVVLAANTRYAFLVDDGAGPDIFWYGTGAGPTNEAQVLPTAQNGADITNVVYRFSADNGASYGTSTTFNRVQVNGSVIVAAPEPGSLALGVFGLAGGVLAVRKRRVK